MALALAFLYLGLFTHIFFAVEEGGKKEGISEILFIAVVYKDEKLRFYGVDGHGGDGARGCGEKVCQDLD